MAQASNAHSASTLSELAHQRELREVFARYTSRRDVLLSRVGTARDRLLVTQSALAKAKGEAEGVRVVSDEVRGLEAAVASAVDKVEVFRAALGGNESSLAERLRKKAEEIKVLRLEADAAAAARKAATLEFEATGRDPTRLESLDLPVLQHSLSVAKAEQIRSLRESQEKHEAIFEALERDRSIKLSSTASRVETALVTLAAEREELSRKAVELDELRRFKEAEAEAAVSRRQAMTSEVESLIHALNTAEAADVAALRETSEEVERLQQQTALLRSAPLTMTSTPGGEIVSMPGMPLAMAEAEATAREKERSLWAARCEEERLRGAAEVEGVRNEGKARYMAVVRSIEATCVSQFESELNDVNAKREASAGEARALEVKLREMRAAVGSARAEKARLEAEASAAKQRAMVEVEGKRERLTDLQATLRRLWSEGTVSPTEQVAFLKKVLSTVPFTPRVRESLESKLGELRSSAPILRSVTRREVLLFRMLHLRRSVEEVEGASAMGATLGMGGGGGVASSTLASQRAAHLHKLNGEYGAALEELERLNDSLVRDVTGFEAVRGKPFMYKGQRLLSILQSSSGAAPISGMGLLKNSKGGNSSATKGANGVTGLMY